MESLPIFPTESRINLCTDVFLLFRVGFVKTLPLELEFGFARVERYLQNEALKIILCLRRLCGYWSIQFKEWWDVLMKIFALHTLSL